RAVASCPAALGALKWKAHHGFSKRRSCARWKGGRWVILNLIHLSIPFFFKKPGGANSQPLLELEDLPAARRGGGELEEGHHLRPALSLCALRSAPSALRKGTRAFLFFRTPRRMTASLKGNEVSCVPHGARGTEIIKAMRFPGSTRCLRKKEETP
ncbi:Hypothetical predicted protein, partial [Lynx pardinus]